MAKPKHELSIIIGALNEEKRIGKTLDKLYSYLKANNWLGVTEVIVVTADAVDNTHAIVDKKLRRFQHWQHIKPGPKVGKGRDIAQGMHKALGQLCLFMDADLATPLEYISIAKAMHKEFPNDLVIGTRDIKKIHTGLRGAISLAANVAFKLGTGMYVRDTQCGFKALDQRYAKKIFDNLRIYGWGFDMEVIALGRALGMNVRELHVPDWVDMPHSTLPSNRFLVTWETFKELVEVAWNYRSGRYHQRLNVARLEEPAL
jgi:dolichyl-phosphate beta-glucosyltransferase